MKNKLMRVISFLLAALMVLHMVPITAIHAHAEEPEQYQSLEGKTLSILGASMSTYAGISDDASANTTIGSNAVYYTEGRHGVYAEDTWWMQVCGDMGLRLLVNNSWSGSSLLHERSGTVGAYVDRCVQLHNNEGEDPDIIAIQMGTNDFQYYKDTLGTADIDYDALIAANGDGTYTYAAPATSLEAAAIVLHKISVRYPGAEVYYLNISQRVDGTDELIRSFNGELKQVVEHFGAHIVDIYGSAITMENFDTYIGDGRVHPNKLGMDAYTEAFKRAMIANTAYQVDTHTVSLELEGVTADYGDDKIVVDGDAFAVSLSADNGLEPVVTVTMGGADITASAYSGGTVAIDAVTADVTITAEIPAHIPQDYRWEFDGTELVCAEGGNALTKNAGTTTDGVFSNTRYGLETAVVLSHDQPWVVEWQCEGTFQNAGGSSGARIFTSTDVNAEYNARYLFKSNTNGLIAMGEKTASGSHNYGIALGDHGIDWTQPHTYRLENRIAADGSNMIWLYVDDEAVGPMTGYYIGTKDQNVTSDWLSGKDFVFPYMGTDTHGFTNCSIAYIRVWETTEALALRYDDHYDVTGREVEILDAGMPTSYQVGYGVAAGTPDEAVIMLDGNTLVATGIGTAMVRIDGTLYRVEVTAAPISLLLLAGQSNMQGSEGNADQSIICPDGMVYATYGDRYTMTVDNATNYAPSALTGAGSAVNVNGNTTNLADWPVYLLNEAGAGKAGPDSGFAYEWVKQTGEKVWIVNAAHGGSSITTWQDGGANYEEAVLLFSACQETLRQEIAAGHYTLSHMGYFWCQGCTDYGQTAQWYVEKYLAMHENFRTELAFSEDVTFEFGGIIPVRAGHERYTSYRQGVYTDTTSALYHESFKDLRFTGPRVAQYWMINNPELSDIWGVCNIGENWVTMPDGTDGVAEYFRAHYENGTVDYTTQVPQKTAWYTPTTPAAVHDSIHYNQIGYNEVGREAARNALIQLGEIEAPAVETSVKLLTWDGYTEANEVTASTTGNSGTLVVPVVYPIWNSKEVTYEYSEGLSWNYYDLLAENAQTEGTLTVTGGEGSSVAVGKADPNLHFADHLSQLPEAVCCGLNLWNILEHDKYFYSGGTQWGIHSSGSVYSVTIPVAPGDRIFATSFGKAGENGHASTNGIRVTFFSDYGIAKTMAPAETYAEFSANGGYLIAPEGAVAINIAMWDNSDTNEIYILNAPHNYDAVVTAPTCTEQGYTTYTCTCGHSYVDSYVEAKGHSYGEWTVVTEATCTEDGQERRDCINCDAFETRTVACGHAPEYSWDVDGDNVLEILAIGNSFSIDALQYVYQIAQDLGIEKVVIGNLYISGCTLKSHAANAAGDLPNYTYYYTDDGTWTTTSGYSLSAALTGRSWDYISMQQSSSQSGIESSYNDDLTNLITYVKNLMSSTDNENRNPCAKLVWHMTWAYQQDSTNTAFAKYDSDQMTMYNAIVSAVQSRIVTNTDFDIIIPCGTAVQNARTSLVGDTLTRDGYHMSRPYGQYLTGLMFVKSITGLEIDSIAYTSEGVCELYRRIAVESVNNACAAPFTVTQSGYILDNYILLQPELYKGAFWSPVSEGRYNVLIYDASVSDRYFATVRFTREELPVGTIIILEDGWRYRPDGWVTDELQTGPRESTTGEPLVVVTEEWWGDYTIRSFNIYQAGSPSLTNVAEEEVRAAFRIYVPTESHAHIYHSVITAPTCTEQGYTTHTCACGDRYVDSYVEAKGHSYGEWTVVVEATCTENGQERRDCGNCEHFETRVIDAKGHDYTSVVTAPTCTEQGYTTHTCACGDNYVDTYVEAKGHSYGEWTVVTEATCTKDGQERRDCGNCDHFETCVIGAKGHDYTSVVTAPTCTEQGYTTHTCACGDSYVDSYVEAKGHSYGEWTVVTEATCTEDGQERRDCGNCDHFETRVIEAKGHDYTAVVTAPTCTEQGYTTHTCACGDSYVDTYVEAKGHNYGEWYTVTEATCIKDGQERRDCGNCDYFETRAIEAKGHDYISVVTAPTCTEQGYTTHTCACGDSYVDSYVEAKGHSYGDWQTVTDSTCTENGQERRDCGNCEHFETRMIDAKGHSYTSVITAPTCTEQGYTTHTCACGDSYVDSYVEATGHSYGEWAVVTEATCIKDGQERRDCGNCDHFETRVIDAKGHDYRPVVTAPTCTEQGYTTHTCAICGDSYVDTYVEAKGHSYGEWAVVTEATCTENGQERRDCGNCTHNETRVIEAKGHDYQSVVTAPTCTAQGYTTHTCACGDRYVDSYVEATGHDYVDGICTACGHSVILLGDVNSDGEIDILDANLVVTYYNEIRDLTANQLLAADVNGDGEVDIMDANMIVAYYNEKIDSFPGKAQPSILNSVQRLSAE